MHAPPPNSGNSYNVRNVNTSGALNNNNAYNGNRGVRPLRWITRSSRPQAESNVPPSKEGVSRPHAIHGGDKYRIADTGALPAGMAEVIHGKEIFLT